ncbi:restriction modification system DNA specificity domain-containing protein [Nitrosomonas sp. Is79A3]|uniref:restriction endonuclease subunit S n=1 Tax=Nitrosomonas sp. (strain Is79A3) TaxID=261292 RepID=UPI000215D243
MNVLPSLLTGQLDIWTSAETEKKSGRGRSSGNGTSVYGIKKLRELILELAVRGKLVPQDPNDEPAGELLKRIQVEKARLMAEGKIKKNKPLPPITDEEKPFELPKGWEWVRLGSIIDYVNGFAFSSKDFTTQGIGVVKIGDIQQGKIEPEFMSRVSEDVVDSLDVRLQVVNGDLVIAMSGATTGKLGFNATEEVFYLNQRVGKIVPFIVSKRFLYFDLTTKIAENLKKSFGSAIPNLSTEQINAIVTAIPPTEEQHRIVAKVDELMALCDQLETQHINAAEAHEKLVNHLLGTLTQSQSAEDFSANWQRIAAHFDTLFTTEASIDALKQTLLQLAVMGKLVPQDPNDEPASELLKRIQAEKAKLVAEGKIKKDKQLPPISDEEKPFELPQGWEWVRLGSVLEITGGVTLGRKISSADLVELPYLRVANVQRGYLVLDSIKTVEIQYSELSRYQLLRDDLLVTEGGDWDKVGRTAIWNAEIENCLHQNHIFRMRRITEGLSSSWIQMYMNSIAKAYFQASSKQTTNLASINMTQLKNCLLAVPTLREQHRIVTKVDELMTLCDQLKSRITQASQLQKKLADGVVEQAIAS